MNSTAESILVVDDDVDTCQNLADILGEFGYSVDIAHNGPAALECIRRKAYPVALLDFKMPGMDGLTLYREIKRLRSDTVAIIVTAHSSPETAEEATSAGVWKVLAKPLDLARLLPLVNDALGQPLVLVVDDDPDLCANLWDLLHNRGFRVSIAHDEAQTASLVSEATHSVVLIDMKLQQGDGGGVFRVVRDANPEARVILITGHRDELNLMVRKILSEGAETVFYKPFNVPELIDTIHRLSGAEPNP